MATELATAYISLVPSASGIKSNIAKELGGAGDAAARSTESSFKRAANNTGSAFKTALKGAAVGVAAVFGAGAVGAKMALSAATDYNETLSKIGAVFGSKQQAELEKWASGSAKAMGQSKQQALEAAGTYGNLLTSFGLNTDASADMSKNLVTLASDLASFNNTSPDDALEALRSGLTGETEPLKRYGIALDDASLKAKALALGIADGKSVLTPAQKAQASYALILERSTNAQGDFARTSSGAANQQRIFAARIEDLKVKVGQALLPALNAILPVIGRLFDGIENVVAIFQTKGLGGVFDAIGEKWSAAWPTIRSTLATFAGNVLSWIGEQVPILLGKFAEWGGALIEWVLPQIPPLLGKLGTLLSSIGEWALNTGLPTLVQKLKEWGLAFIKWVGPQIPPLLVELGKLLGRLAQWIITDALPMILGKIGEWASAFVGWVVKDAIPGLLRELGKLLVKFGEWFTKDAIPGVIKWAGDMGGKIIDEIGKLPSKIANAARGMFDGIKDAFKSALNWIIDAWNGLEFKIPGFDPPGPGPTFPGFTLGVPDIPTFHKGGVVPGRPGQEVVAMLQAGENVQTKAQQQAGAGVVFQKGAIDARGMDAYEAAPIVGAHLAWRTALVRGV